MCTVTVEVPNVGPVIIAQSRKAKHLSITVKRDLTVRIAVPRGVSMRKARQFLHSRTSWIEKHLRTFKELDSRPQPVPLPRTNETQARRTLITRLNEIARMHGFSYGKVAIRRQKTRWGSCSARNNINLNINLVRLPDHLRDYVILHELVHTRIKNHGREFWAELDRAVGGDAKALAKKVRNYRLRQMV
jgi:predicted metal-dependent hydrolase